MATLQAAFLASRRCAGRTDRKSTRLNSSPRQISYAVFCLKKKNKGRAAREPAPPPRSAPSSARFSPPTLQRPAPLAEIISLLVLPAVRTRVRDPPCALLSN